MNRQEFREHMQKSREKGTDVKRCSCTEALGPRVDGEYHRIDGREVCSDCYFDQIDEVVSQHYTPERIATTVED